MNKDTWKKKSNTKIYLIISSILMLTGLISSCQMKQYDEDFFKEKNSDKLITATSTSYSIMDEYSGKDSKPPLELSKDEIPVSDGIFNRTRINIEKRNAVSRLVIVSAPDFSETKTLKMYINHKKTQGYDVKHLKSNGETAEIIRSHLKDIYYIDDNLPMAVLLVGDMACDGVSSGSDMPAFYSSVGNYRHPTDFHYGDFDNDWIQDAMVGRFSVEDEKQLEAQVKKIIHMENGVNGTLDSNAKKIIRTSVINGEHSQILDEYFESVHADFFSDKPGVTGLFDQINAGSGLLIYTGHGLAISWNQTINTYQASHLTNNNVYPVVIGSTCLSGSYHIYNCLGESFVNNPGGGVAYIGASANSYENCNIPFTSGNARGELKYFPGMIGSLYHDISKCEMDYKVRTVGGMLQAGFRAYRFYFNNDIASSEIAKYSTEIYNLLGDPTYMPYTKDPQSITFSFDGGNEFAQVGRNFTVYTAPEAQVAITRKHGDEVEIISAVLANETGKAVLTIPNDVKAGEANLYAIAPNYCGNNRKIIINNDGNFSQSGITSLSKITITDLLENKIINTIDTGSQTVYETEVEYEQNFVKISAFTSDSRARLYGDGSFTLYKGENSIPLTVVAENGITENFLLRIKLKETTKSNDYSLKTVSIDSNIISATGDGWYYDYKPVGNKPFTLNVETTDSKAKCWIEGYSDSEEKENESKAQNKLTYVVNDLSRLLLKTSIHIKVKSEFGEIRTYTVRLINAQ